MLTPAFSKVITLNKMKACPVGDSMVKLILRVCGSLNWHHRFSGKQNGDSSQGHENTHANSLGDSTLRRLSHHKGLQRKKSYEDKAIHESIVFTEKKVRNNPSAEHLGELLNKFWNNHIIIKYYEVCKINKGSIKVKKNVYSFR